MRHQISLQVIEYIQFLQEKVQKYEGSYVGWNQEPAKLMPLVNYFSCLYIGRYYSSDSFICSFSTGMYLNLGSIVTTQTSNLLSDLLKQRNNHKPAESYIDQSRGINSESGHALVYAAKFDEKKIAVSPVVPGTAQNPVDSDMSTPTAFKSMDHQTGIASKSMPFPMSLQPNYFTPVKSGGAVAQPPPRLTSDAENTTSQAHTQLHNIRSCTSDGVIASDKLKEQELTIEGGTINISTAYSQG